MRQPQLHVFDLLQPFPSSNSMAAAAVRAALPLQGLLQVERQVVGWFGLQLPQDFPPGRFPVFLLQDDLGSAAAPAQRQRSSSAAAAQRQHSAELLAVDGLFRGGVEMATRARHGVHAKTLGGKVLRGALPAGMLTILMGRACQRPAAGETQPSPAPHPAILLPPPCPSPPSTQVFLRVPA